MLLLYNYSSMIIFILYIFNNNLLLNFTFVNFKRKNLNLLMSSNNSLDHSPITN